MEDIKLILADIDGTLLNDSGQVTPLTREAIHKLKDVNIRFGISTGRTPYAVRRLLKDWGLDDATDYIIGFNGGSIYNVHTQEMSSNFMLDGETVFELLDDLKDFQFNACIYDKDTLHTLREDRLMIMTAQMNKLELVVDDFEGYRQSGVNKVLVTAEKDEMDRIVAYFEEHPEPRNYKPARSADVRLEVIHPELSKSKGIAILLERLGLRPDQVMTFGDMMNDFDMIRDYVGVAMGNADERIKNVAKYHTASNNDDGIGIFIEENFLK